AQVAIDLQAHGLNSAPTAGEISFECALWQCISQLAAGEVDVALAGAADELNKYPLGIGQRWGLWTEQTLPGEGATVVRITRCEPSPRPAPTFLARITALRLGRYRLPFKAEREAEWIAESVDLASCNVVLTGAGGWPQLEPFYHGTVSALNA